MSVLVIHPEDSSTDFLQYVYEGKGYTVIRRWNESQEALHELIKKYDKVIMLGHGTPDGLLNTGAFTQCGHFIINKNSVEALRDRETVSIWCWSYEFFKEHNLKGFHTGMIISEVAEAEMVFCTSDSSWTKQNIYENMERFSKIVGECIEWAPDEMQAHIIEHYTGNDKITMYNRNNIIVL